MIRVEKTCKQCQSIFQVEYKPSGSGSANVLRKNYCSAKCKRDWYKHPERGIKSEIICKICTKKFYLPPSQAKCRVTCSKACYGNLMSGINKKYLEIKKNCVVCNVCFVINENSKQKFCSPKCSSKSKLSRKELTCEVCKKTLLVKTSCTNRFCNKLCARKAQSLGLIKSHTHGRSGWRKDIEDSPYFKSSLEADFARYCIYKNVQFEYEKKVFEVKLPNVTRFYTPDFYLSESCEFVELKGVRISNSSFSKKINSNSASREELSKQGINVRVIYMDDFYEMLKQQDLYDKIPNLENKNYGATAYLIVTHKDSKDRSN